MHRTGRFVEYGSTIYEFASEDAISCDSFLTGLVDRDREILELQFVDLFQFDYLHNQNPRSHFELFVLCLAWLGRSKVFISVLHFAFARRAVKHGSIGSFG